MKYKKNTVSKQSCLKLHQKIKIPRKKFTKKVKNSYTKNHAAVPVSG